MSQQLKRFYEFGPFRVGTANRLLLRRGEVVALPPKTFDILLTLVEDSGQVLQKEELMQRVWPDSFVEEANLSNQIFNLRKALGESNGEKYIKTIPRRGYRFVAEVTEITNEGTDLVLAERTRARVVIEEESEAGDSINQESTEHTGPAEAVTTMPVVKGVRQRWQSRHVIFVSVLTVFAVGCAGAYLASRSVRKP